jgi:signal transduction histidine kinase/ligand-binding sensor domain-containing protein
MRLAPLVLLVAAGSARPQAAQLRSFGVRDGLIHERVNGFLEDHLGFLWVPTWEGLSRFDGAGFVNFGTDRGLRCPLVWCVAESPRGRIWAGTHGGGAARITSGPPGAPTFEPVSLAPTADDDVGFELAFGPEGDLLVATPEGVRRCADPDADAPRFDLVWRSGDRDWDQQAIVAAEGRTWFLGARRLVGIRGGDVVERQGPPGAALNEAVHSSPRADGSCLVLTGAGLFAFDPKLLAKEAPPFTALDLPIPNETIHALAWGADGTVWVGSVHGLYEIAAGRTVRFDTAAGLVDEMVRNLAIDRAGSLWIGTEFGGFTQLRRRAIRTFLPAGSSDPIFVVKLAITPDEVFASTNYSGLYHLRGDALELLRGIARPPVDAARFRVAAVRDGSLWFGSAEGVFHARKLTPEPGEVDQWRLGSGEEAFGDLYLDRGGTTWVGSFGGHLYKIAPGARQAEAVPFPTASNYPPRTFAEDASGRLWVAPADQLWRRRDDGGFEPVVVSGVPAPLQPRCFLFDPSGLLWVGTRFNGVVALALDREPPALARHLTTRDGLPSDHVPALARTADGSLWFGTGRGLVRFDPVASMLRIFGPDDGLAGSTVSDLEVDSHGLLWIGTAGGLSCLDPKARPPEPAPPLLYVAGAVAGGRSIAPSFRGATRLDGVVVPSDRRELVARFEAVDLAGGRSRRFEHRLEGQDANWSAPDADATVTFAGLAPGRYTLSMRAIGAGGLRSAAASVSFEVLAPLWRRPWFLGGAALLVVAAAFALHQARVTRALALERVRTQIATDLHDDAGANLSQIAILAEVARRDAKESDARLLSDVAQLARVTRSSIADLVWAVDPRRDTLLDLVQRVRSVAANLLEAGAARLEFRAPPSAELAAIELDPATRRHLLFLLQEALNNAARHSAATRVEVEFALAPGLLKAAVRDDGRGFDPAAPSSGTGLLSVRRRARAIGAELRLESAPGRGTRVEIDLPLARRRPRILVRWR